MISIKGRYFDGKTSYSQDNLIQYDEQGCIQFALHNDTKYIISDLTISPRIASTARYITFPGAGQFETLDNDGVDQMCRDLGFVNHHGFIHYLESHKRYVVLTLMVVVLLIFSMVKWGVPALSQQIAMSLPPAISETIGDGVDQYMDKNWLEASEINEKQQQRLTELFAIHAKRADSSIPLRVKFRKSEVIGANAFALPNGTIVFTDDLIWLAEDDEEIQAIMLHEIGHVMQRHSLRFAIQQFGLTILAMTITGDVSASSSIVASLPSLLASQGYSREMEREADDYALKVMLEERLDTEYFARIMEKIEAFYSFVYADCIDEEESKAICLEKALSSPDESNESDSLLESYLSTHPINKERVERFRDASH